MESMKLPDYVFAHKTFAKNASLDGVSHESTVSACQITHISYDDGIKVYYEGGEYPQKLLTSSEALFATNIMKSIFMEVFKIRPSLHSIVSIFNRLASRTLFPNLLKDEYRAPCTLELNALILNFFISWGLNRTVASDFAQYFSHLFDFDNAYYLRLVDIMSETTASALLARPYREVKRLTALSFSRELWKKDMHKMKYVYRVACLALLIPKVRRALRTALSRTDLSRMQYDNSDRYWACLREDYNFMGLTIDERKSLLASQGYSLPVTRTFTV